MEKRNSRILVVDDEPDLVELVTIRLKKAGYAVVTATSGEEGLRILSQDPPDLILVDLVMPKMDGFQLCQRIRTERRYEGIPIVVLTAAAELQLAKRAIHSGADGYLVKPFDAKRLLSTIQAALDLYPGSCRREPWVSRGTAPEFLLGREFPQEQAARLEKEILAKVGLKVSHELRTTLTAIKESVALLAERFPASVHPEEVRLLEIAQRNVERLSQFIQQLVSYAESDLSLKTPAKSSRLPQSTF